MGGVAAARRQRRTSARAAGPWQTAAITPRHLVFAIELTALNFYFSNDPELDPPRVKAARLAAQAHYKKHEHDT